MNKKSPVPGRVECPEELSESQYNLRLAFPTYPQVREGWLTLSAALKNQENPILDLQYGDQPLQTLDIYRARQPNRPLLVFVHGGYWQGGDKGDVSFMATPFIQADINVALLNYSLAPDNPIEDMLIETRQALAWLTARAGEFSFDAKKISLMGHSAGGHLVTMTATSESNQPDLPAFCNVFSISGVHDLAPLLPSSINDALGLDLARADAMSPVLRPEPATARVFTFIGEHETAQFHEQAKALGQAWSRVQGNYVVPDTDHFTILNVLADAKTPDCRRIIDAILSDTV